MKARAWLFGLAFGLLAAGLFLSFARKGRPSSHTLTATAAKNGSLPAPGHSALKVLQPGTRSTRNPQGEDTYLVSLDRGDFLELSLEQQGVDISVAVSDPLGVRRVEVDSPNGDRGVERVLWIATKTGEHRLHVRPSDPKTAGRYVLEVVALRTASAQDHLRATAARRHHEAGELRRREAWRPALEKYALAADSWEAAGDPFGALWSSYRQGQAAGRLGDEAAQLRLYRRAIEFGSAAGTRRATALLHYSTGLVLLRLGRSVEALESLWQAHDLFERLGDRVRETRTLNRIASVHKQAGDSREALEVYRRALVGWRALDDAAREATVLNNIGELYLHQNQLQLALDFFYRVLNLRREVSDLRGEAITLTSLGTVHRRRGDLDKAWEAFATALPIQRRIGDRGKMVNTLIGLSQTELRRGLLDEARGHGREALELAHTLGAVHSEAITRLVLGEIATADENTPEALDHYREALALLNTLEDSRAEASAYFLIAQAQRSRGRLDSALASVEEALGRVEELRQRAQVPTMRTSFFASKQGYYEFYIDLLMDLHALRPQRGYDGLALQASERSRARSLLENLTESQVNLRQGIAPELLDRERELQWRLRRLDAARSQRPALGSQDEEIRRLASDLSEVRSQIRTSSPRRGALIAPRPPDLQAIQENLLDPDTHLLEYALGERRSFLFWVSSRAHETFELPGRERIERLARKAHGLLQESHKKSHRAQLRLVVGDLSRILLDPVTDRLKGQRLVIVAGGALQYVPFGALVNSNAEETSTPRTLVMDHEIVSLPALGMIEVLRRPFERPSHEGILAVLADPVFHPEDPRINRRNPAIPLPRGSMPQFPRLPYTTVEAQALLALVEKEQRFVALGTAANLDLLRSETLSRYKILHFATHGLVQAEHPELSGLALALYDAEGRRQEGILYAHEIYNLNLPAELVVLSACRTALGQEIRGEGLLGLPQGFLSAGASRVVVSLWDVDDRATQELMHRMYRGMLQEALPPSTALHRAQRDMLRQEAWNAPYFWAGFVLQGEWR